MATVTLNGLGLMAPGLAGWPASIAILSGVNPYREEKMPAFTSSLLPSNERRRTTQVIKLALQVAEEALIASGLQAQQVCSVFASSGGDCETIHKICQTLTLADRPVSPTHFHHSVHNTSAGYWAIATGCRQASVSLSAHDDSFSAGLLEAVTITLVEQLPTLLVAYDYPAPFPLSEIRYFGMPFAVAMVLMPGSVTGGHKLTLALTHAGVEDQLNDNALEALRTANPAARSLPLLQSLAQGEARQVLLPYVSGNPLAVRCEPCG